jgi:hypothetical protein
MMKRTAEIWNERYSGSEYVYGEQPIIIWLPQFSRPFLDGMHTSQELTLCDPLILSVSSSGQFTDN